MQLLAEGFRSAGHDAMAVAFEAPSSFGYKNDKCLNLQNKPTRLSKLMTAVLFLKRATQEFQVFHFFFGRSLLPGNWDLPILKQLGKKVVVHFRGSDIRNRRWVTSVVEPSLLRQSVLEHVPRSTPRQLQRIGVWERHADAILVSTPDLLEIVPHGAVSEQAIDLARWPYSPPRRGHEVTVAHSPSSRNIKGTEHLVSAIEVLKSRGYAVRLDIVEGVNRRDMVDRLRNCDIGVDQLLLGSYGNAAVEFMALGKPVVARLGPWYATNREDLPIVNSGPLELVGKLEPLIKDAELRARMGWEGRKYSEKWHDVHGQVTRLAKVYDGLV